MCPQYFVLQYFGAWLTEMLAISSFSREEGEGEPIKEVFGAS